MRPGGINFALFSAHAERVELCLFDARGEREIERLPMPARTHDVWHGMLHGGAAGQLYGYRVYGPYEPAAGHRFNHHKLLLDPYARRHVGELVWCDAHYGYRVGHPQGDLSFDARDNAAWMPKCMVVADPPAGAQPARPATPLARSVIYEAHVRGLTQRFPGLAAHRRGTYLGAASRPVLRHLSELGVTALELLPVHAMLDDHFLVKRGLSNYWGYQTLGFFAPASRYAVDDPVGEFRAMVRALHRAGLECILDVVYNHTAEGNERGPTLSFRGIDNKSYYRLAENQRYYVDDSGTGNSLAITQPRVLQMVLDSLRHWVREMGVDGFRFDLATTLGRERHGFDRDSGFFDAVQQDPVLSTVKLIAEPWDIGPGGYQLGQYPQGWSEWNDQYRDCLRRFWAGERGQLPALARSLLGSAELFEWQRREPTASVNFITAHDGFTLKDVVSFDEKHNEANGEDNRDGHDANHSSNHGTEGPTDDPVVAELRARQQRNLLASLLVSQGVPMLLAGDEVGNSQGGNNNAYCQDNEIGWIDWRPAPEDRALSRFVARLIELRCTQPALRRPRFLHGSHRSRRTGLPDVSWLNADGAAMSNADWHSPSRQFVALQLLGDAGVFHMADGTDESGDSLLILLNADVEAIEFPLTGADVAPLAWERLLDTAAPDAGTEPLGAAVDCAARSLKIIRGLSV